MFVNFPLFLLKKLLFRIHFTYIELSITGSLTHINTKSSSGEIEGVDKDHRRRTSQTTGKEITQEPLSGFSVLIVGIEGFVIEVLESEVEGLSGEISDDISPVTSPESEKTFFLG